jgi:hypothetical protein
MTEKPNQLQFKDNNMTRDEILKLGYIDCVIYDDFFIAVGVMTYGKGRIIYSDDEIDIGNAWCYKSVTASLAAMHAWNPLEKDEPPDGWFRNPITGQRRPDGDAAKEYIMV